MSVKRMLFFLIALVFSAGFAGVDAQADPGIPDTVRVESVQVNAGDHFGLNVFLYNDEDLSGGTLGFRWGTPDLFLDSISYLGGVLESKPPGQRPISIDNTTNYEALTGFFTIFDPPVPPGTGKWCTFWMTADGGAADQVITFDSVKVEPSGEFVLIATAGNVGISPQFQVGTITIGNPQANTPPTLAAIGPQGVAEGANLNFNISATDAESTPTLSAVGLPAGANFVDSGNGAGNFDWTPGFADAGPYNVTFIASDGELADSELVVITVSNTNRAPNWAAVTPQNVAEGAHLEYGVSATDPDSDDLTLTALSTPTNGGFADNGGGSGTITFDPDFTQAGAHDFVLVASDGNLSDTVTVSVTVSNTNRAPVWAAVTPQEVAEGAHLDYGISASDPDADSLSMSALSVPANGALVDNFNGTGSITFDPDFTQEGVYNFILEVSDGDLTDTVAVQVTVTNVNRPPSIAAIADTTIAVDQSLLIAVSATDLDGDSITLLLDGLPASNATFTDFGDGTAEFAFTPDVTQANTAFPMTVSAGDADTSTSESFTVSVGSPPVPDSAFITPDTLFFTLTSGAGLADTGCALLTSTNAPAGYTINVLDISPRGLDTAHIFVTPLNASGNTDDTVCVAVTDGSRIPGVYYNTVQATVDGVANNPVDFVVCMTVEAAPVPDSAALSADTLWFTAIEGEENVQVGCAYLSSTNAPAFFTATNDTDNVFASAVAASGNTDDSVCVSIASSALTPGTYYDHVRYSVDGVDNNPLTLVLCLTVDPVQVSHTASVAPDTLFFTITEGDGSGGTGCATVSSTNAPANYNANATGDPFFTDLLSAGGTTNDSICFDVVNTAALTPGVYYNDVAINVDSVTNNPVGFVVCLTVEEVIVVDTSILAISDSLFIYETSVDTPSIFGDSLVIFNVGSGPEFSWSIDKDIAWHIDTLGDTTFHDAPGLPDGLSIAPLAGSTPGVSYISLDTETMGPGQYYCRMMVIAEAGVQDSPQYFEIHLTLHPSAPPELSILEVSDSILHHFVAQGDLYTMVDTIDVFNTGNGPEIDWQLVEGGCYFVAHGTADTVAPIDSPIDVIGLFSGTTPSSLMFSVTTDSVPSGEYWCDYLVEALDSSVLNSPRPIKISVTVNPVFAPSGDTVWVSTVPGTPGSKVKVPVNMTNQGPICGLQLALEWGSAQIFLDSVSYEGTRLEGLNVTESTFDNGSRTVSISFNAESFAMAAGSGKVANLYFDIFSGITDGGVVPITLDSRLFCPQCNPAADNCTDDFFPEFFPGGIVIDSSANVICGRVIDTAGNEIPDAVVEVWDFFPQGNWFASDTTEFNGAFKFNQLYVTPYTLYAYANGYYPATLEDINFGSFGLEVVLTPVSEVQPTNEWVDFYCDVNTYMGLPLPVGSVIDAFDPDGDHVGTWTVVEEGKYGFMPVYRDDPFTVEDDGATPGDTITLYINGMPAEFSGERVWTKNGDRFEVCLNYDGSIDKSFCLSAGWHLISWSVDTEVDDVDALFAPIMDNIDVILGFEEVGVTYDPDLPEFSTLNAADHKHGYWVHIENLVTECVEWNVSGLPVLVNTPIALEEGWNLVSYLPPVSLPTGSALVSQEGNLRVALGYDNGGQTYDPLLPDFTTLPEMRPCFGYWLKAFSGSDLIYPGFNSAPFIQPDETEVQTLGPLAKLGVEGELHPTTEWVNLYSGNLTLDGQQIGAGVSVRALNTNSELVGFGITDGAGMLRFTPVYGSSSEEPAGLKAGEEFTLEIDGQPVVETFTYSERGARIELGALTSSGAGTVLPSDFVLEQNYPNPFNPKTTITFQLPHDAVVTLEVFNVLGEKIATLANGPYSAGETTVSWEAQDGSGRPVASGVYFYRLKAGENVQTRKMVLLK